MSTPNDIPREVQDQLALYFDNQATPEVVEAIQDWLAEDPANARILAEYGYVERMIYCAQKKEDASAVFALLAEIEDAAETEVVEFNPAPPFLNESTEDPNALSAHDFAAAGSYLLQHALTSKPAKRIYAYAGVAAAVLLALVLLNPWSSNITPTDAPLASDHTNNPAASTESTPRESTVATLTAEHNATWAEGALAPGSALHPNTHLTLTAGFAEITTHDGAIAILQAPATVELLDNDNALRLHAGKLVGICETESSKGFLVHTAHMDITDLGTRFGISADADETEVHVFEGKVQAEKVDAAPGTAPTLLVANQSARTSADTDVIASIDHDADRFAALLPTTIELPGTGFGLAVGDTDPNWQIVAIDGKPLDSPQTLRVVRDGIYIEHFANDPATSQFVAWNPGVEPPVGGAIAYTFRTLIDVPEDIDPANARLVMRYIADNKVQAVVINGNRVEIDGHAFDLTYDRWAHCVIDEHLDTGSNTILFEIHNRRPDELPTSNVGLRLQWELFSKPEGLQEINSHP